MLIIIKMRYMMITIITIFLLCFSSFNSKTETTNIIHSEVDLSDEQSRFANFASKLTENLVFLEDQNDNRCEFRYTDHPKADYYAFAPALQAKLKKQGDKVEFSNYCFKNNVATLLEVNSKQVIINIESSNPVSMLCKDTYAITTTNFHDFRSIFLHGQHWITLKNPTQDDLDEIRVTGIRIYTICEGFFGMLKSMLSTVEMFVGGFGTNKNSWFPFLRPGIPDYMEKTNADFLRRFANFTLEPRGDVGKKVLELDASQIKTGDFLAISRLDGLDPLIMFGTGSHLGHSAVASWIEGELYVLESQDGWYWPTKNIQKTKWSTWLEWAHNADFHVALLPLSDEARAKFDVEAAIKWYLDIEGHPYGYRNFIFGWLDTENANLAEFLDQEVLHLLFSTLGKISKTVTDVIIGEGLNLRLGTKDLTIAQVVAEAARRDMTFEQLVAMPEIDGWEYSNGVNYVCSSFVIAFYKAGKMFGDMEINATEFAPKDIYQLDIFDKSYKDTRPQICRDADPDLDYCQIMGTYKVTLPGYNSVKPYSRMNEKCPSVAPHFFRTEGC